MTPTAIAVKKTNGSSGTLYWYMTPGIVAESDLSGALKSEYVFFNGERIARRDGPTGAGGVFYYFSDHLKTASVITDSTGTIKAESDYYPWGGELQFINNESNHYKFTGKERDSETQLDYFGARYYSNGLGRFVSADWSATPIPVPYADFGDPQSLNLYSYVRNIPTVKVDADGHDGCCTTLPDPTPADWDLIDAAGASGGGGLVLATVGLVVADVVGAVWIGHELAHPSHAAGQSNADEKAAIQQASQERAAQNGGVDPQQAPEPAAAAGGRGKKGGGTTYNGQRTDGSGRKLGPSGKPIIHNVNHSTKKGAKDAARNAGSTKPMHHPSPKVGKPHFHSTVKGDKKHDGVHHNYPE